MRNNRRRSMGCFSEFNMEQAREHREEQRRKISKRKETQDCTVMTTRVQYYNPNITRWNWKQRVAARAIKEEAADRIREGGFYRAIWGRERGSCDPSTASKRNAERGRSGFLRPGPLHLAGVRRGQRGRWRT